MKRHQNGITRSQLFTAVLAIGLLVAPTVVRGYGLTGVGGSLGYANPQDLDGTAALGVHAVLEKPGTHVHLDPNLRYWKVNGIRDAAPNMDLTYHFGPENRMTPYVGGGLGVNFVRNERIERSQSDLGVNAIAGLRFPTTAGKYFLEGRYTASDVNQVSVLTGITFHSQQ